MFRRFSHSLSLPQMTSVGVFVIICCMISTAWADGGATELFIQHTTSLLRTLHGSLSGVAVSNGYTDKELHFGVSILMGAIGYPLMVILFQDRVSHWWLVMGGLFAGLVPGVAKELIDMSNPPDYFSWADVVFDATGVLTGIVFAWILMNTFNRLRLTPRY